MSIGVTLGTKFTQSTDPDEMMKVYVNDESICK